MKCHIVDGSVELIAETKTDNDVLREIIISQPEIVGCRAENRRQVGFVSVKDSDPVLIIQIGPKT